MTHSTFRLDPRLFTSTVARRAFVLFIACALLPISALAIIAFQQVTSQLQEQGQRRLQQTSKTIALLLVRRLLAAEADLAQTVTRSGASGHQVHVSIASAVVTRDDGSEQPLVGAMTVPRLTSAQVARVASGKTVLSVELGGSDSAHVVLSRLIDPDRPREGIVHGLVDREYLWAFDDDVVFPSGGQVFVLDEDGRPLFSSDRGGQAPPDSAAGQGVRGYFAWTGSGTEYLAARWALFLKSSMGVSKWTIVVSQPSVEILAPITSFKRIFVLVLVLTLLTVLLLSGQQIRRSLTPLAELKEGARRLALGDLKTRVQVTSHDEFADVADGFNEMAGQLERQFHGLALRREITAAVNPNQPLNEFLQVSSDALVRHLGFPSVGIWLAGADRVTLELQAQAGLDGRSGGKSPRLDLPLSSRELDRIRVDRLPCVVNLVPGEGHHDSRGRAREAPLVAFVAHPLVIQDRVLGIAGAFATSAFDAADLSAFGLAAGDIARCIDRLRLDEALRNAELQTRQLQKMEAVGRLAGGVAHDFNNLLTVITGRTYLLLHDLAPDHPFRKGIQAIDATAQRAAHLTRQLLAFSRKQLLSPTVLNLNEVVEGLSDILRRLTGDSIQLEMCAASDLGSSRLDRGQLEQVLVNLVVNARDAMPSGGRIIVTTENVELDDTFARQGEAGRPGPHVMISVSDSGSGMDEQTRARIFEPFFTTKEVGKGTGLGLATVLGIVQQSEGHIRVESTVGVGTTFRIYFPRIEQSAQTAGPKAPEPVAPGDETVLVVDDEVEIQDLLKTTLTASGYVVLGATSASEAMQVAMEHPGPIHLLLTDIVMPGISGVTLAERLTELRPGLATVFVSGYGDFSAGAGTSGAGWHLLEKPFTPDMVAQTIRRVLDSRNSVGHAEVCSGE